MRVVDIDRVVIATDDLDRTSETLSGLLDIDFGTRLTLSTETTAGEHDLQSVIDTSGIGIDIVQSDSSDDAVSGFVDKYGTGLYALALQVADIEEARQGLTADGVEPVGEISAGDFTEYLFHPRDFDGIFVFLAEYPHAYESNKRLQELRDQI